MFSCLFSCIGVPSTLKGKSLPPYSKRKEFAPKGVGWGGGEKIISFRVRGANSFRLE